MTSLLQDERAMVAKRKAARPQASDEELLRRFVADRSDRAFAELVTRHGPFVMAVCRRILGHQQDAEDAFQATFLVLARKAGSLRRPGSLPAWLHKAAYRIALRAQASNARRREQPLEGEAMIATETLDGIASDYDQSALDEELNRLPEKYRLPLFLCCVEGASRDEAASRLGWSLGSLKGRLERGRRLLRRRLVLRGVSLGVALTLLVRMQQTAQATVASSLVASTVQAGMQYAAGQSVVGYVSQNALSLANGSLQVMSLTTSKVVLCSLLVIGSIAWGTSWLPAPAIAGGEVEGQVLILQADGAGSREPTTQVAFLADDQGDRPRRSPEAEAGPRRSPEAEAGRRRSAEAEAAPRRSAEAEVGRRRSAEREGTRALGDFRPQTERETALYRMILQLQREVAQLRRELHARAPIRERTTARDSEAHTRAGTRDRGPGPSRDSAYRKSARIYQAYDKDRNSQVSFEEFLAMREGADDPRVQAGAQAEFKQVDRNGDGHVSFEEFFAASQRRHRGDQPPHHEGVRSRDGDAPRERDRPRSGGDQPRDGDRPRGDAPRDREGAR